MALITFSAGQRLTAAQLQTMVTQIDSLTAPGLTTYGSDTTTLTATTTNPTKGNSTYLARYRRPTNSDLIHFQINITIGSTFSAGSGAYRFLLPVAADASENLSVSAYIEESGVAFRAGMGLFVDSTHFALFYDASGAAISSSGLSTSWTTGDALKIKGFYFTA